MTHEIAVEISDEVVRAALNAADAVILKAMRDGTEEDGIAQDNAMRAALQAALPFLVEGLVEASQRFFDAQCALDNWDYKNRGPKEGGDQRCLCTIEQDGMVYVGVAIWTVLARSNSGEVASGAWLQNGTPIVGKVLAWQKLPEPARRHWVSGVLV